MFITICYDVSSDRRRARIAKRLIQVSRRVQYSVFEFLGDERTFLELRRDLELLVDHEEDSVRYYILCAGCSKRVEVIGKGPIYGEEDVIII